MEKRAFSLTALSVAVLTICAPLISLGVMYALSLFGLSDYAVIVLVAQLIFYLAAVGIVKLFTLRLPKAPTPLKSRLRFGDFLIFLTMCFGLLYVGAFIGAYATELVAALVDGTSVNPVDDLVNSLPLWCTVLITVVMAPIMEEIVFRRVLLDAIRPFGDLTACLTSALLFGFFHMNLTQFFYAAALGFILGYVMVRTNRIICPILLHAIINLFGSVLIPKLADTVGQGSDGETVLNLALVVLMFAGTVLFLLKIKKFIFEPARFRFSRPVNGAVVLINVGMAILILLFLAESILTLEPSWMPDLLAA